MKSGKFLVQERFPIDSLHHCKPNLPISHNKREHRPFTGASWHLTKKQCDMVQLQRTDPSGPTDLTSSLALELSAIHNWILFTHCFEVNYTSRSSEFQLSSPPDESNILQLSL